MHLATENGHLDVARLLVESKAQIDTKDDDGNSEFLWFLLPFSTKSVACCAGFALVFQCAVMRGLGSELSLGLGLWLGFGFRGMECDVRVSWGSG